MIRVIGTRIVSAIPTFVVVLLVSFLLVELMPGDPARAVAGEQATPEIIEQLRVQLGLDRPLSERFLAYVGNVVSGDLGASLHTRRSVAGLLGEGLVVTASLGTVSMVFAITMALGAGTLAGLRPGSWWDRVVSGAAAVGLAFPSFVFALLLVVPLAVHRRWLPATGYEALGNGVWEWLRHLLLPALALAVNSSAELVRQVRGALVDTMEQDFIRTCKAMGLSRTAIVAKHAAKNAAAPVVTVTGLQVARIIGAAVIIEQVFALPGFGTIAVRAVLGQDLPVIQGLVLISAAIVLVTNLLVDLSYTYFSPMLRG